MFASWKKAGNASLVAAAAVASLLVAPPSARALEGIQGRHAIFYPSLELVYQHDDNFFLVPDNETTAESWLAKAHFRIEVPGARQHLTMEYAPQWRDVNIKSGPGGDFELQDNLQHFWDLRAQLKGSSVFGVDVTQHFVLGNLEVFELDSNRGDIYDAAGERFMNHEITVDFKWEGNRQAAKVWIGHDDTSFDDADEAPAWFELSQLRLGTEYAYKFTPLSRFLMGFGFRDATNDYTRKAIQLGQVASLDANRMDLYFGFQGELGRTTTGRAQVGFLSLDFDGTDVPNADYDGVSMKADVTKSFSRYSKLIFGAERTTNFSAFLHNTHYNSNRVAVTFSNQPQGRRLGWTLAGAFQRNDYDTSEVLVNAPFFVQREDDIKHLRAEVGYHALEHLSLRLNYRWEDRESNFSEYEYEDNLVIFQVQLGF